MKHKLVKITWRDIAGGKDWQNQKELLRWAEARYRAPYYSIGYLIHKSKNYVVLAASYEESDGEMCFNDVSMIPRSVITKIETI